MRGVSGLTFHSAPKPRPMVSPMTTSLTTDTFFDAPFLVNISTALIACPDDIAPHPAQTPGVAWGWLVLPSVLQLVLLKGGGQGHPKLDLIA